MASPSEICAPATCARDRFTPLQRFAVLFGVGFGLDYGLRFSSFGTPTQTLLVVGVTTALLWGLGSAGATNRRLMLGTTAMCWTATTAKLVGGE